MNDDTCIESGGYFPSNDMEETTDDFGFTAMDGLQEEQSEMSTFTEEMSSNPFAQRSNMQSNHLLSSFGPNNYSMPRNAVKPTVTKRIKSLVVPKLNILIMAVGTR